MLLPFRGLVQVIVVILFPFIDMILLSVVKLSNHGAIERKLFFHIDPTSGESPQCI